jgi:hypothetical protein
MDIYRGQGTLFVQDDWMEEFWILTCTGVGDISIPTGDLTAKYCPDPEHAGRFIISSKLRGEAGLGSYALTRPIDDVYNFLLQNRCGFNSLIAWMCEGVRELPQRYMMSAVLFESELSDRGIEAPVAMEQGDDDRVNTTATVSFEALQMIYNIEFATQTLSNTADANGVAFLPRKCASDCSAQRDLCEIGFMGLDGAQYNSEVKYTISGGSTWAQTTTDPFLYDGGDAGKPVIFELTNAERVIVPRIEMAVGEYAEIAYTEDRGVTWVNVYVGTVDSQWITKLFSYQGRVWAVCSHGYIYMSSDIGETWTAQELGAETAQTLRDGCMYTADVGYVVGDNNEFLYTLNAGEDWASRVGPAVGANLLSVAVNDRDHVYVGASDGTLYRTVDRGQNWETVRAFGVGTIPAIYFDKTYRYFGTLIYNTAAPVGTVYRSINGGATWQVPGGQGAAWNAGLNDLWICDPNVIYTVGEAFGGLTFVAVTSAVAS